MDINYLAVAVAGVLYYVIGAAWYSPVLFARPWMDALGFTKEDLEDGAGAKAYILTFVNALIMAFVLACIVEAFGATTVWAGLQGGFWCWLGFVATTMATNSVFAGRSLKLYAIDSGYHLVGLLVMGGLLAIW
ncbi:MAG: DUF1761 domain-containing protein [Candidatus Marinimicrobia bacterium]|nr:DUF1761 domain-containing protein [Candidatus Neomarinimicrobiota bacterium]MCF7828596.1 DUF1761 domain-containing protein [Candidatus Neomarinimicrobiota bacterium]MCF7880337.1 DUF1761 domain-containing protein [Candidatus Neomarinimicrobiota bacterium]